MGELRGDALGVALPANKDDVSFILRAAREHNVSVTPQGGNTGLVGGSIPQSDGAGNRRAIVLNLSRMNAIHEVSARQFSARVDAGVILSDLHGAVEAEVHAVSAVARREGVGADRRLDFHERGRHSCFSLRNDAGSRSRT